MLFNSPVYFLLFLPIVVSTYFLLNRYRLVMGAKLWLVFSSLFFYAYWNPSYVPLILLSIAVNFSIGYSIRQAVSGSTAKLGPFSVFQNAKSILVVGILFNLGLLGYFKYTDFFIANVNVLFSTDIQYLNLILPLAISFFTFQQIAYIVDCYKSKIGDQSFIDYSLFVTFFPQLISGPIVHHSEMMPQFKQLRNKVLNWENITQGVFIFTIGLFKKVVIADTFSNWANLGFDTDTTLTLIDAWQAGLAYVFQLYFDFSGYCDMAIGAALLFNIRLPINFNSPYKARNTSEFWNRWHMTLSRWLRDYLYIPLGGNRRGKFRTYCNLAITMLLSGLWHGASWNFVIFGAINGVGLIIHRIWSQFNLRMFAFLACTLTFLLWSASLIFFRADTSERALEIYTGLFGMNGYIAPGGLTELSLTGLLFGGQLEKTFENLLVASPLSIAFTVIFAVVAFRMPNLLEISGFIKYDGGPRFKQSRGWSFATALVAFWCLLTMLGNDKPQEFLYYQF